MANIGENVTEVIEEAAAPVVKSTKEVVLNIAKDWLPIAGVGATGFGLGVLCEKYKPVKKATNFVKGLFQKKESKPVLVKTDSAVSETANETNDAEETQK